MDISLGVRLETSAELHLLSLRIVLTSRSPQVWLESPMNKSIYQQCLGEQDIALREMQLLVFVPLI